MLSSHTLKVHIKVHIKVKYMPWLGIGIKANVRYTPSLVTC